MDFRTSLLVTGLGLCVVGGIAGAIVFPQVPVGGKIASTCLGGLVGVLLEQQSFEHGKFLENQRFEHEKSLREMDAKLRQLQPQQRYDDEGEMLRLLEDWSAPNEV
jgi:hypothetical protein